MGSSTSGRCERTRDAIATYLRNLILLVFLCGGSLGVLVAFAVRGGATPKLRYDVDLVLVTTSEWLTKWHIGRLSLGDALSAGVMQLRAPLHLERMLATMGGRGAMEPAVSPLA